MRINLFTLKHLFSLVSIVSIVGCASSSTSSKNASNMHHRARTPETAKVTSPARSTSNQEAISISTGFDHSCALRKDGTVWCWGYNGYGQLGDGTTKTRSYAARVPGLKRPIKTVVVHGTHSCALDDEASLWCWGLNGDGQLGDGTKENRLQPVLVRALRNQVQSFSLGTGYTCAVHSNHSLWCWGQNTHSQLGDGTTESKDLPVQVKSLGNQISSVTTGAFHTCALLRDGSIWCWGSDIVSRLKFKIEATRLPTQVPSFGTTVASLSAGFLHTCALLHDGSVWCWNGVRNEDSTQYKKEQNRYTQPFQISSFPKPIRALSSGIRHNCALAVDGYVWCWGANPEGQLGDGTTSPRPSVVRVLYLDNATGISAGATNSCATLKDGSIWCWGKNHRGQLGDTTYTNRSIPTHVSFSIKKATTPPPTNYQW
jgi:alpha-tubulin suppressor-like RCC1 family protein